MEIRMTVHVPPRRPRPVEVLVRWRRPERVEQLRAALADHLDQPVPWLSVAGRRVADDAVVGEPPLLDGVSLTVDPGEGPGGAGARPATVLELASVGGPDAGRGLPLVPPGFVVGRSPTAGLRLEDPALSREHCRLEVAADGIRVVDLGSTNGVDVDGSRVVDSAPVDTTSVVVIGATTLGLRRAPPPGMPLRHPGDGTALLAPVSAPPPALPTPELAAPRAPEPPVRGRVPWVAALAPVPVVAVLALFLGPQVLAFAVLGPVVLLATGLADRVGSRRRHRRALAEHATALRAHEDRVGVALAGEGRLRRLRHPDPYEVLRLATGRASGLWSRPGDRTVRLGLGQVAAACRVLDGSGVRVEPPLDGVPVVVDLDAAGGIVVLGAPADTARVLAAVVGQLVVRCPPSDLAVEHTATGSEWAWLDLLPHRRSAAPPVLVVPDAAAPDTAARVAAVRAAGGFVLAASRPGAPVPAGCSVRASVEGGAHLRVVTGDHTADVLLDGAGPAWCDRLARALAPVRETGRQGTLLPATQDLGDLLGPEALTVDGVRRRWDASDGPTATVGSAADGPVRLDLRRDGPHVLVGGTTGSGKSEFLRTLVTALALDSPPDALSLLLVDFKGGAAFGPCADLPQVVGLVTDLDEHLVQRVLISLEAELRRRERLLAASGAADLDDHLHRAGPAGALPRLVVVVDELRALVDEFPDAVSALVRLAAQGRSLGIHLVLATQRPAGTITAEVQANVNLRIAFRVRDRADSVHVVEDESAAALPADAPGRGVVHGGDGARRTFQVALARPTGHTGPSLEVLAPGTSGASAPARSEDRAAELSAVVGVLGAACEQRGGLRPPRPWLPPLPDRVDVADGPPGAVALVDEPDLQRRTPWVWDPEVAVWRVVGQPRSGRSTAIRRIVAAAGATVPARDLHVQVLAADPYVLGLAGLPHVGTVAALDDTEAVEAVLEHLEAPPGPDDAPRRLLVVDGWEQLADLDDPRSPVPLTDRLLRLVRDGSGVGCVVAGGRDLLRPRWSALGGEVLLLGRADPLDLALLGTPSSGTGTGSYTGAGGPGRGLRARDGREVQVVDGPAATEPVPAHHRAGCRPWTHRPLPTVLTRDAVGQGPPDGWVVGVTAPSGEAWAWRPPLHGRRLVVIGPPRSGRSTTLHALARSAGERSRPCVLVRAAGATGAAPAGVPVLGPDDVDRLVALRTTHPGLLVLVDDADRLDEAPVRPVLVEVEALLDRDGGALAVVTTPAALGTRFRGLDVTAARHRCGILLRPGPDDGPLLGLARTAWPSGRADRPPGRGVVVVDGRATPIQVLTDEPATPLTPAGRRTPRPAPAR